jgi:argininosuccinate synthase
MTRIVVGYSGGVNITAAIPWMAEQLRAEIIAVTIDIGQGHDLADIRERALAAGAVRAHVLDARDEFAREYILPALHAGALDNAPAFTASLAQPLIASKLIDVARIEASETIAHGCADTIDQAGIEASAVALDPSIAVIAPVRDSKRADIAASTQTRNMSAAEDRRDECSNLWARTICRSVDTVADADFEHADPLYALTRAVEHCPADPAYIEIAFEAGVPVSANGIDMPLVELIESVETIAGVHGVGRMQTPAPDRSTETVRCISEAPAAVVLQTAHHELERLVISPALARVKRDLANEYVETVRSGLWFSRTRAAIDSFIELVQRRVTGSVHLALLRGECTVVSSRIDAPSAPLRARRMRARVARR